MLAEAHTHKQKLGPERSLRPGLLQQGTKLTAKISPAVRLLEISESSSAAWHIARDLGLAHHGQCELIHCTMPIDPIFHIVWIVPIHLVGELRHSDFEEQCVVCVASVKTKLSTRCCTYPTCSQNHRASRIAIAIYDPAYVVVCGCKILPLVAINIAALISTDHDDTRIVQAEISLAEILFSQFEVVLIGVL